jgi:hypothetical protein
MIQSLQVGSLKKSTSASSLHPDEATHELHPSTCSLLLSMLSFLLRYLLLSSPSLLCSGQRWHVNSRFVFALGRCDALMSEDCEITYFDIKTDDLRMLHGTLQEIDNCPGWYSNPRNMGLLPFPMLYSHLPTDRFALREEPVKVFEYMGREGFGCLWDGVQSFRIRLGSSQLFFSGNMGCGKSHMLAAFACLLFHLGERPVYIDCRQMLMDPLSYIQSAMLCSFSDASSSSHRDKIRSFQHLKDTLDFCGNLKGIRLYFIIDQINTLEAEAPNADLVSNSGKEALSTFLQRISLGHYSITSASENYRTARRMAQKQTNKII